MRARRLRTSRSSIGIARALTTRAGRISDARPGDAAGAAERGAATVEFAMALPLLAAFTIALCGVILLTRDAVLAQGAAREGARAAAVSGDRLQAAKAARAALPAGRHATVAVSRPSVDRVKVQIKLSLPLPFTGAVPITAEAVAAVEPGGKPTSASGRR
jgi:hypothetical protein